MQSTHTLYFDNSEHLTHLGDESIDLVVTSPPYPMIEMWDDIFSQWDPEIAEYLKSNDGDQAFRAMHNKLDCVWKECSRVTKKGGFVCINIGDATRNIADNFKLYSNHSRIVRAFEDIGFDSLPLILWRKQTNAPNKFMGSGMLPSGAYVTLEHEYILIFRKGKKRRFNPDERENRQESAFFWEERNIWFSDVWDFKGIKQKLSRNESRNRSAAFPLELANRLVNMFSMKGDTVLDPFAGTGTTVHACLVNNRNSIGYELDASFRKSIYRNTEEFVPMANKIIEKRCLSHIKFMEQYIEAKGPAKYFNNYHGFPVVTRQELNIKFEKLKQLYRNGNVFFCDYEMLDLKNHIQPVLPDHTPHTIQFH